MPFQADHAAIRESLQPLAGIFGHSGLFCIQNSVDDHFFRCNNPMALDLSDHQVRIPWKGSWIPRRFLLEPKGAGSGYKHRKIREAILIE